MQYRAVDRVTPALAIGREWRTPHLAVASQPSDQHILGRGCRKLLFGRDPRIHDDQTRRPTLRQLGKQLAHRRFATRPKPHTPHQPYAHTANQDYADRSSHKVGTHRAPRTVTLTFTQQGRFPHLAPQTSNARTVYGDDLSPLAA